MAKYTISGVWKNSDGVITHYSFHEVDLKTKVFGEVQKKTKAEAIRLVETFGNSATTMVWNYSRATWNIGEDVTVVGDGNNKYLRSDPDNKLTDNLGHLIKWTAIIN